MSAITLPDELTQHGEPLVEVAEWLRRNNVHRCDIGFVGGRVTLDFFDDTDCVHFARHWLRDLDRRIASR